MRHNGEKMKVYIVRSQHRADGEEILAVLSFPPTPEQVKLLELRSVYNEAERRKWCKSDYFECEVEDSLNGN